MKIEVLVFLVLSCTTAVMACFHGSNNKNEDMCIPGYMLPQPCGKSCLCGDNKYQKTCGKSEQRQWADSCKVEPTTGATGRAPNIATEAPTAAQAKSMANSVAARAAPERQACFYECTKLAGDNGTDMTVIARAKLLKRCLNLPLYADVMMKLRNLKLALPKSIYNAVFVKEVCIKNKKFDEYLFSPSKESKNFVYLRVGEIGNQTGKLFWKMTPVSQESDLFVINALDNSYPLVLSNTYNTKTGSDTKSRYLSAEKKKSLSKWELFSVNDDVAIRSDDDKNYVFADVEPNGEKRSVGTWRYTGLRTDKIICKEDDLQCTWTIEPCFDQRANTA